MKKTGIAIIIVGLLLTAFTGFGFLTPKNVDKIGNHEISESKPQEIYWTPYVGVGLFFTGGLILLTGIRRIG
ncbi:MAG TPA: hypothetical protein VK179_13640 [Bacteroidales bacterium]|nr:hypothetical protein [Bacteroidales bacterium]